MQTDVYRHRDKHIDIYRGSRTETEIQTCRNTHRRTHTHTRLHRHAPRHKYTDTQRYQTFLLALHLINHSGKFFRGFGRPGL